MDTLAKMWTYATGGTVVEEQKRHYDDTLEIPENSEDTFSSLLKEGDIWREIGCVSGGDHPYVIYIKYSHDQIMGNSMRDPHRIFLKHKEAQEILSESESKNITEIPKEIAEESVFPKLRSALKGLAYEKAMLVKDGRYTLCYLE